MILSLTNSRGYVISFLYPFVEWTEEDEKTYKIDFKSMEEYPAGDRSKAVPVRKYSPGETFV